MTFAATISACAGFESNQTLVSPSAPSLPNLPSGPGTLTGTWSSISPLTIPNSWSCGEFQWAITSQTQTTLSGQFYAICAGVLLVQGQSAGQLNGAGTEVTLHLAGSATVEKVIACPFDVNGTGFIEGSDAIRIHYEGTTCLGPVHGDEMLRRPAPNTPPPPPPAPPEPEPPAPTPPPADNPYHVKPGPLTVDLASQVPFAVVREYPYLNRTPGSDDEGTQLSEELVLRSIWHLKLLGFDAGRQRNPSGAISNDKLTILINGQWRAFDIASMGYAGHPMQVIFLEIGSPNPIGYPGLPD
jgi:hypothetical protein